jgi:hypothetical protein
VSIYSNIVILSTSVLFASDLWLIRGQTASSLAPLVSQAVFPRNGESSVAPSGSPSAQHQAARRKSSKAYRPVSQATSDPPFLRRSIQFGPESLEPTFAARTLLRQAADWLRQHRAARDTVVEKFLESSGIDPDQIVGVKGWDNFAQSRRPSHIGCQQINRSARIFVAGSVAP